jgi:CubicO group peptidase (beta-lactamase class C family)
MRNALACLFTVGIAGVLAYGARFATIGVPVGTGYAAKTLCSLAFNSGQDPEAVFRDYVAREIAPLGRVLRTAVDPVARAVTTSTLGLVGARAIHRDGLGCTLVLGTTEAELRAQSTPTLPRPRLAADREWPDGTRVTPSPPEAADRALEAAVARAFREPEPAAERRRQTKAVVIVRDGRILAERYASAISADTPLQSWSMAKSLLATLVGIAVGDGRIDLEAPAPVPEWHGADDPRRAITLDQLLRMSSGLAFGEDYTATGDTSRMLFTRGDAAAFAAVSRLAAPPDSVWSYSSGTSNIVSGILRRALGGELEHVVAFARTRLFDPLGMTSALCEPDASGSFVGSSFCFATARDWARFGLLHLEDGVWNGERILPPGWVRYVTTPTPRARLGRYGAHWWLNVGEPGNRAERMWSGLPTDTYAALGHSGQHVFVIPSERLVVVRLGLSRSMEDSGGPELAAEIVAALRSGL